MGFHLKTRCKFFLLTAILMWLTGLACAQVDTEFWFAPPEVTSGHGDLPIFLRISTADLPSTVTITQPANAGFTPIVRNIPANTTVTIDLSPQINILETRPPNSVRKTGLYISTSNPVTVYYEVAAPFNTDIFVLKGKNGLGNQFIIPGQNRYFTGGSRYNPTPTSSFDIVATQNNTVVTITPSNNIVGHLKGESFVIRLNRGETYSATNVSFGGTISLAGSKVESNNPIAITLKEDSMQNGTCFDLLGDQLVPTKVAGSEYVIMRGFLQTQEFAFVTAIEDHTQVFLNGNTLPVVTLDQGQVFTLSILTDFTYVETSKPSYVIHITGFGCELGMAVLPSLNCRGSTQIGFTRSTNEFFGLNILVPKEGIGDFTLNGSTNLIQAFAFSPVPGSNDEWYAGKFNFTISQISTGAASLISNSLNSFQIGVINGDAFTSCRFGYFSSFSTLFIGDDFAACPGEINILDAGADKDSYLWSTGETTPTIQIDQPGVYGVTTTKQNCVLVDTVVVELDNGILNLGPDVIICAGTKSKIDGGERNFSFNWSDGSTQRFLETSLPGTYTLEVVNYAGCHAEDEITISLQEPPVIDLGEDILKCPHEVKVLNATTPGATYLWSTGQTSPTINVTNEGEYSVTVTQGSCIVQDNINVSLHPVVPKPVIQGSRSVCPNVTDVQYTTEVHHELDYQWQIQGGLIVDQSNPADIKVDWGNASDNAFLELKLVDDLGCFPPVSRVNVKINERLEPTIPVGADTVCYNDRLNQVYTTSNTTGSVYTWEVTGGAIASGQGSSTLAVNWDDTGLHELYVREESTTNTNFCDGESLPLQVLVFRDSAAFNFRLVTAVHNVTDNESLRALWTTQNPSRFQQNQIWLRWKDPLDNTFSDSIALSAGSSQHARPPEFLTQVHQFQLSAIDLCGNHLTSFIHENVVLKAEADTVENKITLTWNEYKGWPDGVSQYRVWATLSTHEEDVLLATIPAGEELSVVTQTTAAFTHQYWVEAVGINEVSLSNKVDFSFDHPLIIYNVITANTDTYNDVFMVKNIHLYPNNKLIILNRWGKTVYEATAYNNTWDARDLPAGVYFYSLTLPELNVTHSGSLSVLY